VCGCGGLQAIQHFQGQAHTKGVSQCSACQCLLGGQLRKPRIPPTPHLLRASACETAQAWS
jgi:hypothetical protein